jgi:hypothetical protein
VCEIERRRRKGDVSGAPRKAGGIMCLKKSLLSLKNDL